MGAGPEGLKGRAEAMAVTAASPRGLLCPFFFDLKDAKVSKEALSTLDFVIGDFGSKGATKVEIEGNTDASAAEAANKDLARTRANAVRDALIAKGLPAAAISAIAAGSSKPLVPTPKGTREPQNRRVEITLYGEAVLPPLSAGAQRPAPECLSPPRVGERPFMRNTCSRSINVQMFDLGKTVVIERELRPNEEMPDITGFGAVCPAGHHSDVALTPNDETVFAMDVYSCIKK